MVVHANEWNDVFGTLPTLRVIKNNLNYVFMRGLEKGFHINGHIYEFIQLGTYNYILHMDTWIDLNKTLGTITLLVNSVEYRL